MTHAPRINRQRAATLLGSIEDKKKTGNEDARSPDPGPFDPARYYGEQERELERLEPAWAKAALFFRTGDRFGHAAGSRRGLSLIQIHDRIKVLRTRFEGGNTMALLQAVALCAEENLPLPTWLATAYVAALNSFLNVGGAASLDDVFRSPTLPTGTPKKTATARQDWQLGVQIWDDVWQEVRADEALTSLDSALDAVLAKTNYGIRKTKARDLVQRIEDNQIELLGHSKSKHLSAFLDKRRKR